MVLTSPMFAGELVIPRGTVAWGGFPKDDGLTLGVDRLIFSPFSEQIWCFFFVTALVQGVPVI